MCSGMWLWVAASWGALLSERIKFGYRALVPFKGAVFFSQPYSARYEPDRNRSMKRIESRDRKSAPLKTARVRHPRFTTRSRFRNSAAQCGSLEWLSLQPVWFSQRLAQTKTTQAEACATAIAELSGDRLGHPELCVVRRRAGRLAASAPGKGARSALRAGGLRRRPVMSDTIS
jgi:hypothetical protein